MISTQEEWRQPGTGAWLGGAEENGFVRNKGLSRKKMPAHRDLKLNKKIQANRASSKATRLFLMTASIKSMCADLNVIGVQLC